MSICLRSILAAFVLVLPALPATSHEFWIDPEAFQVSGDTPLEARLRVGQSFNGSSLSYLPRNFTRFEVAQGDTLTEVTGRFGDNPALNISGMEDGLVVVLHETTDSTLTYNEWDRFVRFAEHKDFADIEARHLARGLPMDSFIEVYSRHAKSLMAYGSGAGVDQEYGLRTEFVALANPFTDDLSDGFPVLVLLEGEPRADAQVELFDRAPDGEVTVTLHRTDEDGHALLPVEPGHVYLADAVTLLPYESDLEGAPVWQTLWASLTFMVPE